MFTLDSNLTNLVKQVCDLASKNPNQALECVLLEVNDGYLSLTAGNGVVEIRRVLQVDSQSNFTTAVNAKKFYQSISSCKNPVVTLNDDLIVKSGRRRFTIKTIDPNAYPIYPDSTDESKIDMGSNELVDCIKKVAFAAAKNDVRYMLNGVFIGKHAVATNGHRVCVHDLGLDKEAIVNIDSVSKMPEGFEGDVYLSENILAIKGEGYHFKSKLIDGKYISYEKAIPTDFDKTVSVDKSDIIDAIKAAKINAPESLNVLFKFGESSEIISKNSRKENAHIGFECTTTDSFEIGFNSDYMISAISSIDSDDIKIGFTEDRAIISDSNIVNVVSKCVF